MTLFSPTGIGKNRIKNRIAMAPMASPGLANDDGGISERALHYFEERARGGTGLIISNSTRVETEIDKLAVTLPCPSVSNHSSFVEFAETMHFYDAKLFVQLTAGFGRNASIMPGVTPVSASSIPAYFDSSVTCRELSLEEVERLVKKFGDAAEILYSAGVDGIELHGHEGYLLDQFATSIWNKRTDKYGGDLEDRLRFPIEIIEEIKDRVGKDYAVTYRYGPKHHMKGPTEGALPGEEHQEVGRDIEEGIKMAKLLEKAGIDALHLDPGGGYESYYWTHPPLYMDHGPVINDGVQIKKAVKVPVIFCGKLNDPELAEKLVNEDKADMVAMGRALLADPYWPAKVREGRTEDIRPCIGGHAGCQGRVNEGGMISCAVNPLTGKEKLWEMNPVKDRKKVLVAGAGIAGMEAARVLAERGHEVSLYEKRKEVGGHIIEASVPDFKKDIKPLLDWYKHQIRKLEVLLNLDTEVTKELVDKEEPDIVIVATGSRPLIPKVPGIEKPLVSTTTDLLSGEKEAGDKVIVAGGGLVGSEVALWLKRKGKEVTIVEELPELLSDAIGRANPEMLLDLLNFNGVEMKTNTKLVEVTDDGIIVIEGESLKEIKCDTLALAVGFESNDRLYNSLREKRIPLYKIGDCKKPGLILNAVWDGYKIANSI